MSIGLNGLVGLVRIAVVFGVVAASVVVALVAAVAASVEVVSVAADKFESLAVLDLS